MNNFDMNPLDLLIIEGLANPEMREYANDVIDIVTARSRKEITELEADFLLWGIEEQRAPKTTADKETLALIMRLCAEARARVKQGA